LLSLIYADPHISSEIGVASTVCAITMAVGKKSTPNEPSGPDRDSSR
jgi:hypothetical protein